MMSADENLMAACEQGDLNGIRAALIEGADIDHRDEEGLKPIDYAIRDGGIETVGLLIDRGVSLGVDGAGETPLMFACYWDDLEAVMLFANAGVDINAISDLGQSALYVACESASDNEWLLAKCLVGRGADMEIIKSDFPKEYAAIKPYGERLEINKDRKKALIVGESLSL